MIGMNTLFYISIKAYAVTCYQNHHSEMVLMTARTYVFVVFFMVKKKLF